ncbi:MAG: DoxX family protein [Kofleriaceae bacterium]
MLTFIKTLVVRSLQLLNRVEWSGPLLVRLTIGLVFATTGWGKLHNLDNVTGFFGSLGIPAPGFHAVFVSGLEFVGGLLLIVGLGTRIASALLVGVMAVAIWTAKLPELHGLVDLANTIEFTYLALFVWLVVQGPGLVSIDHLLARRSPDENLTRAVA